MPSRDVRYDHLLASWSPLTGAASKDPRSPRRSPQLTADSFESRTPTDGGPRVRALAVDAMSTP
eukprot:12374334-Karenia_brevis.AAC.1